MMKHCDAEIEHILTQTVPPIQLDQLSIARGLLSKYQKSVRASKKINLIIQFLMVRKSNCTHTIRCKKIENMKWLSSSADSHNFLDIQHVVLFGFFFHMMS